MKNLKEFISFRTQDSENDIWCEKSFLFQNEDAVECFFKKDNKSLLKIFSPDSKSKTLINFEIIRSGDELGALNGPICQVNFFTDYAGSVLIYRMRTGYLIE